VPAHSLRLTAEQIASIAPRRLAGESTLSIGVSLGISQDQVRTYLQRAGVTGRHPDLAAAQPPQDVSPRRIGSKDPLPAGHPDTWGLIVAGTSLAGAEYRA